MNSSGDARMDDHAIEATNLTKTYRSRWRGREVKALQALTLRVRRGTTFGLLGANGAGKTTFVKVLLSAVHPTAGEARVFGLNSRLAAARRPIGYLPENHRFPTYFTGRGMLDFYAGLSGMTNTERRQRVDMLLERVELTQWADVRLGKYSKGMLQRVGLAQALMHRPRLLILDEPSDGVDPVGRIRIREILNELGREGVTVFLNSHLLTEVEAFCEEVAILHRGALALTGRTRELTAGRGYRLTAVAVPERLQDEVAALGSVLERSDDRVTFLLTERGAANEAIDRLRMQRCEVEAVVPTTSTLEEVFIRTVQETTTP